jgi:hypothetical protein
VNNNGVGIMKWIQIVLMSMFFFSAIFPMSVSAGVDFEEAKTQSATIGDVKFSVTSQVYKVTFSPGDYSWGTRMFAKYETASLDQLEDYAIVQFTRGCQFNKSMVDGKIVYYDNILRYLFNGLVKYKFADWVIDSEDDYPMYGDTPEDFDYEGGKVTRHGFYTWNRHDNFDQDGEVFYYKEQPKTPYLYTDGHPGTAFYQNRMAKNVSLEFKTCLYKTKDIPLRGSAKDLNFAKPIQCFNWSSSFIYDFSTKEFSRPIGLDPHCTE